MMLLNMYLGRHANGWLSQASTSWLLQHPLVGTEGGAGYESKKPS